MPPQTLIKLKSDKVQIKMDMDKNDFKYFTTLIQNNVYEEWIKERKLSAIKNAIDSFLGEEYREAFIIIIALDPCYNLSYKKNCFLIIKIDKVCFFIYKPKPSELPRLKPMEQFQVDIGTIQAISDQIQVTASRNIPEKLDKSTQRVKQYFAGLIHKYAEEFFVNPSSYETILVTKIRQLLCIAFQGGYWQIFLSKKIDTIISQNPDEVYLELSFYPLVKSDDPQQTPNYRLIMFQKQGQSFKLMEKVKLKSREVISFVFLLIFFITLVTCKDADNDLLSVSKKPAVTPREQICQSKQEILGFSAIAFFGLLIQRQVARYVDRSKNKKKFQAKQSLKIE